MIKSVQIKFDQVIMLDSIRKSESSIGLARLNQARPTKAKLGCSLVRLSWVEIGFASLS